MGKDDKSQSGLQVIIHPGTDEETLKKDSTESIPIPKINATNDNTTSEYFIDFLLRPLRRRRYTSVLSIYLLCKQLLDNAAHCLKITQNVAFEFLNFGIFHQLKLTCLVTLIDRKLQIFKNSPKWTLFGIFD